MGHDMPFPYEGKENYVLTRSAKEPTENVTFVNQNIDSFIDELRKSIGKDIWLIGGGEVNSLFLKYGLVDRIILTMIPVTLGKGIPLFPKHTGINKFELVSSKSFEGGLCQLTYDLKL